MRGARSHPPLSADEVRGLWLGLIGVLIFSLTLPMTRLAVGSPDAPQLSGWFVAFGRAAVAGILSLFFLAFTRAPRPAAGPGLAPAQRAPMRHPAPAQSLHGGGGL